MHNIYKKSNLSFTTRHSDKNYLQHKNYLVRGGAPSSSDTSGHSDDIHIGTQLSAEQQPADAPAAAAADFAAAMSFAPTVTVAQAATPAAASAADDMETSPLLDPATDSVLKLYPTIDARQRRNQSATPTDALRPSTSFMPSRRTQVGRTNLAAIPSAKRKDIIRSDQRSHRSVWFGDNMSQQSSKRSDHSTTTDTEMLRTVQNYIDEISFDEYKKLNINDFESPEYFYIFIKLLTSKQNKEKLNTFIRDSNDLYINEHMSAEFKEYLKKIRKREFSRSYLEDIEMSSDEFNI